MSISYTNPIQPDDIPELLTSLSKDRAILKKRRAEKYAAIGISVPLFTASLLCAMFGYVYLFFEERFAELLGKFPAVGKFADFLCDHLLLRNDIKWYFSVLLTIAAAIAVPAAFALLAKLVTAAVYHPKVTISCAEKGDEAVKTLFTAADENFEQNARLNDRGKAPKIASLCAAVAAVGGMIFALAVFGAKVKISKPLLYTVLVLITACFYFVILGFETLFSLIIKLFYFRNNKNIFEFRAAAEQLYESLAPLPEENSPADGNAAEKDEPETAEEPVQREFEEAKEEQAAEQTPPEQIETPAEEPPAPQKPDVPAAPVKTKQNSPELWTALFAAENEESCRKTISDFNKTALDALRKEDFDGAAEGLKNAATGLLRMSEYDSEKYEPGLYITLYALGKVSAFGRNNRSQAAEMFKACKRIAEKCADGSRPNFQKVQKELPVIDGIIADFESDMTMEELAARYAKNFPADLCGTKQQ